MSFELQPDERIHIAPLTRQLDVGDFQIVREEGKQTRLHFSGSSETPVERFFGNEILVHSREAVRLGRAASGAVPLLFNHDRGDVIGMVDEMRVSKGKLMVDAHLFDTDRAREIDRMLDGGLRNVSIGYRIHTVEVAKNGDERVIDWEPLEQSIVSIPADPTVGLGRAQDGQPSYLATRMLEATAPPDTTANAAEPPHSQQEESMTTENTPTGAPDAADDNSAVEHRKTTEDREQYSAGSGARVTESPNGAAMEEERIRGITNLCKANKINDDQRSVWINEGLSVTQVSDQILLILERRGQTNPQPASALGLTQRETRQFSIFRALRALSGEDREQAAFEMECSRAIAEKLHKPIDGKRFYVPFEVMQDRRVDMSTALQRGIHSAQQHEMLTRDLLASTDGAGGFLVATENVGFTDILRNRSVAFRMGARRLSGLVGDVTVPRQSAAATAIWLETEGTSTITESQQTFVQMAMTPKTVGAYTEISRQLLLQSSPDAEGIVVTDLAAVTALAVDVAALNGSGATGQPLGILNTAGIGGVTGTSLGFAGVLEFQEDVAGANVMPARGGYVTTPTVSSLMIQRVKYTSTASPLWEGSVWDGTMQGFPAMSSLQVPAATMIFGDWSELIIGEWGVLEIETNPFANFQAANIGIRAIYSVDVGVRRPAAFSEANTIT